MRIQTWQTDPPDICAKRDWLDTGLTSCLAHMSGWLIRPWEAQDIWITASHFIRFDEVTGSTTAQYQKRLISGIMPMNQFHLDWAGLSISKVRTEFMQNCPKIKDVFRWAVAEAKEKGYKRRCLEERRYRNFQATISQRSFGERVAMNSPIRGTNIIESQWARAWQTVKENHKSLVLTMHDELLVERQKRDWFRKILEKMGSVLRSQKEWCTCRQKWYEQNKDLSSFYEDDALDCICPDGTREKMDTGAWNGWNLSGITGGVGAGKSKNTWYLETKMGVKSHVDGWNHNAWADAT